MNKLEMAHEFGKAVLSNPTVKLNAETLKQIVSNSWNYADAMQAEEDKREDKARQEVLFNVGLSKTKGELNWSRAIKLVSDLGIEYAKYLLEDDDTTEFKIHSNGEGEDYIGTIFADDLKRIIEIHEVLEGCSNEEWQPDWSQAPEWAKYWAVDKDLSPFWHEDKPKFDDVEFYQCGKFCAAPLFSYKGPWRDSVRKRP